MGPRIEMRQTSQGYDLKILIKLEVHFEQEINQIFILTKRIASNRPFQI